VTLTLDHIQLAIPTGGETAARAFWCDLIGLMEIPKPAALQHRGGLWLGLNGNELHLGVEPAFSPAKKAHPGFVTSDITRLADRLRNAKHPFEWDSSLSNRRRFFTTDPFGNRLEFLQPIL
jgi:Glyoxalase/Bleomycin resistance protein/Dioxygenase superfamily